MWCDRYYKVLRRKKVRKGDWDCGEDVLNK